MTVTFAIHGTPIQQGSARAFVRNGRAVITSDTRRDLRSWRRRVGIAAKVAAGGRKAHENVPVTVRMVFRIPPPQKMPKGRVAPTVTPDLDKLERAVFDALTQSGVIADDKQIVDSHPVKVYATQAHPPGVWVELEWEEAAELALEVAS
jgi:Holliday junction resolvase RusA-like endonuclease